MKYSGRANSIDAPPKAAPAAPSAPAEPAAPSPAPPPEPPKATAAETTGTPAEKPAEGGKSGKEKPKAAENPADKVPDKPADKAADKPAEKPAGKSAEKAADKPADKPAPPPAPAVTEALFKEEAKKAEDREKAAEARHKEEAKKAEDREKAAEARHKALLESVAKIAAGVAALLEADDLEPDNVKKAKEAVAKRRADKAALAKKMEEFLQNIIKDTNALKKIADAEAKEPGQAPSVKAILEAYKVAGKEFSTFLNKMAHDIMDQNSSQHKLTQEAAKLWAREQVGFNVAGYVNDFCKVIANEVRSLLKEVGDLREQRRAMYM